MTVRRAAARTSAIDEYGRSGDETALEEVDDYGEQPEGVGFFREAPPWMHIADQHFTRIHRTATNLDA
jgi:hypothetical protein